MSEKMGRFIVAGSDTTHDLELAGAAVAGNAARISRMQRMRGRLGQCAAGTSTCALGITVAVMAAAQQQNIYEESTKPLWQQAPEAEAADAAAAAAAPDMILGIPVDTMFFVAAGVMAVFWFTLGGGRKPKVSRN